MFCHFLALVFHALCIYSTKITSSLFLHLARKIKIFDQLERKDTLNIHVNKQKCVTSSEWSQTIDKILGYNVTYKNTKFSHFHAIHIIDVKKCFGHQRSVTISVFTELCIKSKICSYAHDPFYKVIT
jgi:hypothetical protein